MYPMIAITAVEGIHGGVYFMMCASVIYQLNLNRNKEFLLYEFFSLL